MMKRSLLLLPALALALVACDPAASVPPSETPAAFESAPEKETPETAVPPVGTLTMNLDAREDSTGYYDTEMGQDPETGENRWVLYRLDYPSGQQKVLYDFGPYNSEEAWVSNPFVQKDAVYVAGNNSLYRFPLDGGEVEILPAAASGAQFSDENACYQLIDNSYTNSAQPTVRRVDLQTGATTEWKLPAMYIAGVYGCSQDRVLIGRLITDRPLPSLEDEELFDAVLQSSTLEYDWLDITTGEVEKILSCPYAGHPDENGQLRYWGYLGMTEDSLYFKQNITDPLGHGLASSIHRCALDGSGMETVLQPETTNNLYPVNRGAQLAWLMDYDYTGPATIYDLEQGKTYKNISIQAYDSGWPLALTNDGRVLVNDHYDGGQPAYAYLDTEDYLAGSRNWTLFTEAEN